MPESTNSCCKSCAFRKGAAANLEPDNRLKAEICVLGAIPFYCHRNFDWKADNSDAMVASLKSQHKAMICEGWRREVGKLAQTGYYAKASRLALKLYAIAGLEYLAAMLSSKLDVEKEFYANRLKKCLKALKKQKDQISEAHQ